MLPCDVIVTKSLCFLCSLWGFSTTLGSTLLFCLSVGYRTWYRYFFQTTSVEVPSMLRRHQCAVLWLADWLAPTVKGAVPICMQQSSLPAVLVIQLFIPRHVRHVCGVKHTLQSVNDRHVGFFLTDGGNCSVEQGCVSAMVSSSISFLSLSAAKSKTS